MFPQKILRLPWRRAEAMKQWQLKRKIAARYIGLSPNEINRLAETRRRISL